MEAMRDVCIWIDAPSTGKSSNSSSSSSAAADFCCWGCSGFAASAAGLSPLCLLDGAAMMWFLFGLVIVDAVHGYGICFIVRLLVGVVGLFLSSGKADGEVN